MANTNSGAKLSTFHMAIIALMTAITCILGPLALPIPISPVPISLTNLVIYFSIYILGWKKGTLSYILYLLLGLVGLPVFSGFSAGVGKLFGPTGGYLIGFIFMAIIGGFILEKTSNRVIIFIGFVFATAVCYLFGTAWLAYQAGLTFVQALWAGVIPYIPGDIVKIILAILIAPTIKKSIQATGVAL